MLVEPESPQRLADAMCRLGDNLDLRRELGRRAREFAEERLGKEAALLRLETKALR